jgi:hypothetical protein
MTKSTNKPSKSHLFPALYGHDDQGFITPQYRSAEERRRYIAQEARDRATGRALVCVLILGLGFMAAWLGGAMLAQIAYWNANPPIWPN